MSNDAKGRPTRQITTQIDPSIKQEFYDLCRQQNPEQTPSQVLRWLIRNWIAEQSVRR